MLPFTERQFFDLFERYNEAIWPLQLAAYALGVLSVGAVCISHRWSAAASLSSVALLWVWTGLSYHWAFFSSINPMARVFAVLFVAQALKLIIAAVRGRIQLGSGGAAQTVGWIFILYAAVLYPLLNMLLGHGYPRGPSFGVTPCPLVIFTFGLLLFSKYRLNLALFVIPTLWAVIGGSAAWLLNVLPDLALPMAAALALVLNMRKANRTLSNGET